MDNYITIGVTGGIGSGKSYVCGIIEAMGYPVFYSDFEAKKLLTSDTELISEVKSLFGEEAYLHNDLNKSYLASQIFSQPILREKLNALVHPKVRKAFKNFCQSSKAALCFNEAAILFETDAYKNFDHTILITAPMQLKIDRLKKRDSSSIEEIQARMKAQWSDEKKAELADFIIVNDEQQPLLKQVETIISQLKS